VVLGGGSGGLACSKEAADLGKKVALLDFVQPSPAGTRWGIGGTCVNVGCIPKKLMHRAAVLGEAFSDAREFGWGVPEGVTNDWEKLVSGIQDHIGSLNFGYRVQLRDKKVTYLNAYGRFLDPHTMECTKKNGKVSTITADKFVIATGGRPRYLGVPGDTEHCITSDDIFSLPKAPGKTLVVGASYIALECAGFLTALGFETHVMSRSIYLRGFDQEIAEHIGGHMERHGTIMIRKCVPTKFEKEGDRVKAFWKNTEFGIESSDVYDTVLLAVGRDACTSNIGLETTGVALNPKTGKIPADDGESTNVPHIFALGDILDTRQELTPVAIKAGRRLAQRLFNGGKLKMDYNTVPTTVFTPLEYTCIGMSEEQAVAAYGADNVEVYVSYLKPLEWTTNHQEHDGVAHREDNVCYCKLITNLADNERVVGLHYVGPDAGEVGQGYAVAMKCGATKADFDATVGIHPTVSEEFTTMDITKRSGKDPHKTGC